MVLLCALHCKERSFSDMNGVDKIVDIPVSQELTLTLDTLPILICEHSFFFYLCFISNFRQSNISILYPQCVLLLLPVDTHSSITLIWLKLRL